MLHALSKQQWSRRRGFEHAADPATQDQRIRLFPRQWLSPLAAARRLRCRRRRLGLIGGGYGDGDWLSASSRRRQRPVGCGFITWSLAQEAASCSTRARPAPRAMFLSFGDPKPFAERINAAGVPLICQVQTVPDAERAHRCGADVDRRPGHRSGRPWRAAARHSPSSPKSPTCWPRKSPANAALRRRRHRRRPRPGRRADARRRRGAGRLAPMGLDRGATSSRACKRPPSPRQATTPSGRRSWTSRASSTGRHASPRASCAMPSSTAGTAARTNCARSPTKKRPSTGQAWAEGDPERSNTFIGEVAGLNPGRRAGGGPHRTHGDRGRSPHPRFNGE